MRSILKALLVVGVLATVSAARAATCDARGYDPDISDVRASGCPQAVTYSPPQAIDYDAPHTVKGTERGHELSHGSGSGEPDRAATGSETSGESLETIWTAA